jgi:hypothetical protein
MATAIAGGLLVAAMTAVGATARARQFNSNNEMGVRLAKDLLDEVLAKPYADALAPANLGPETGEGNRKVFDDIDDFHKLTDDPASSITGESVTSQTGWSRDVQVVFVTRANIEVESLVDEGVKLVTVRASRNGRVHATLSALRTKAWDALMGAR